MSAKYTCDNLESPFTKCVEVANHIFKLNICTHKLSQNSKYIHAFWPHVPPPKKNFKKMKIDFIKIYIYKLQCENTFEVNYKSTKKI